MSKNANKSTGSKESINIHIPLGESVNINDGRSLPTTSTTTPMPQVKPPKKSK